MAKTIVITGASSGFGRGAALKLAGDGNNLVLAARRTEPLEELARECGPNALAVTTDAGREDDMAQLAETAIARFGQIDVWINNAGVAAIGRFDETPVADHARIIDTNLLGAVFGSHLAIRQFRHQGHGTLINVASLAGKVTMPYYATYCATKAAVIALGAALRQELELHGPGEIHVCTVLPWAADTPFWDHAANYTGHSLRMYAIDDPADTVDAIVGLIDDPKDEVDVGAMVKGTVISSHLAPEMTEAMSTKMVHKALMEDAPPAPHTSGSLHRPLPAGTGVEGGVREKIEAEDRRREG